MVYEPASIEARCEHCLAMFPVPKSAAGSQQNCPECGRATKVEGENDPLWSWVKGAVVVGLVLISMLALQVSGPVVGAGVFCLGSVVLVLVRAGL